MLRFHPAVFAVGDSYHIMVMVTTPSLMWVEVGGKRYYDETNGILRSKSEVHRIIVPTDELDAACGYTVCEREIIERRAYFTKSKDVQKTEYAFRPVPGEKRVRAFHIADTHNNRDEPIEAAKAFGPCDFLILNGDILNHCENAEDFSIVYDIASAVTGGELPIVFSRGNHDMRGANTEIFPDYTPNRDGKTYYTFRLGDIWGMVLDCGEDKLDSDGEYGNTVCCHPFRERQTAFIRDVIKNAGAEYLADGVKHRIVISHIPFTFNSGGVFDIENELYAAWARLIGEHIKPQLLIHAHVHEILFGEKGGELDSYGTQPCPAVIAARLNDDGYASCGFLFDDDGIEIVSASDKGEILPVGRTVHFKKD